MHWRTGAYEISIHIRPKAALAMLVALALAIVFIAAFIERMSS
jgi:hypothetical protein